jgi:transcriptional regulator with XRE-family HTH domain
MDTFGKRLRYARNLAGLTQAQVAAEFEIDRVNVTQWEGDTTSPEIERLPALAAVLQTTVDWLLEGKGTPPGNDRIGQPSKPKSRPPVRTNAEVRELDTRAGAGGPGVIDLINVTDDQGNQISTEVVKDYWRIPESYLRGELRLEASKALIIEVSGDSGYDPANPYAPGSIFPGDRVIVDARDTKPSPPGPFLVYDGTGLVVKLCEPVHGSDPPAVRLLSRNPTYTPYTITVDDGHVIVGRVRGRISAM